MLIRFTVKESFAEILAELRSENATWIPWYAPNSDKTEWAIVDDEYNSSAKVSLSEGTSSQVITIKTAWSGFEYTIFDRGDSVDVMYEGAYRGLLQQMLLPQLTPTEDFLQSTVESSLKFRCTLKEYAEHQAKLHAFRTENSLDFNYYAHPKCVNSLLKTPTLD